MRVTNCDSMTWARPGAPWWHPVRLRARGASTDVTLFLHGAFAGERFLVWGEVPPKQAAPVRKPRGRRPKVPPPPPSPFDLGPEVLAAALSAGWPEIDSPPADKVVVWLPSKGARPVASRPLIEDPPEATGGITIAPWTVSALVVPIVDAVYLLSRCAGRSRLAPGVFVADDLAFWAEALRFAGALVARRLGAAAPAGAALRRAFSWHDGSQGKSLRPAPFWRIVFPMKLPSASSLVKSRARAQRHRRSAVVRRALRRFWEIEPRARELPSR